MLTCLTWTTDDRQVLVTRVMTGAMTVVNTRAVVPGQSPLELQAICNTSWLSALLETKHQGCCTVLPGGRSDMTSVVQCMTGHMLCCAVL